MNDIKPSPFHICMSIVIALIGLKLLIGQIKGNQSDMWASNQTNRADDLTTIVISPLTWIFTIMSIFQSILIGLLLYFIRSVLLKLSSMDSMFFACLETLGHNQTIFLQELEGFNDSLFEFLNQCLLTDSIAGNEPINMLLTRMKSRVDTLSTNIHRMDQSISKSLRDINNWLSTCLTPLALPPLLIPPPAVLSSHHQPPHQSPAPAASSASQNQQLTSPNQSFQIPTLDTGSNPHSPIDKRLQTITEKIPNQGGVKGRDYILKTELGVFNLGTKQGRDQWQELVRGDKTASSTTKTTTTKTSATVIESRKNGNSVGNYKFGSCNNVYGQGLKMSNLVIARSPSGSTETSTGSVSDKENGGCSQNLEESNTAATAYTEEVQSCSGEYGLTIAELTVRLEEGERKQYRRIFLPGRGWASIKRLQQEMANLKQKEDQRLRGGEVS